MTPRGIRNNNPGNIRKSATTWRGQSKSQPDKAFVTFDGPEWGLRAIAKILQHYQANGFDTVREIVARWAPPVENDTGSYVDDVARHVVVDGVAGVNPDERLNLHDPGVMVAMLQAIVRHENGQQPFPVVTYIKAVQLAGLVVKRAV